LHSAINPLAEGATVRYVLVAEESAFVAQAFATGLLSAFAHSPKIAIRNFEGEAEFTASGARLENAHLHLRIPADSLEVIDGASESDREEINRRTRDEVLETDRFSEIVYDSSKVTGSGNGNRYWLALSGELTLRGITRTMPVSAKVIVNGNSLRATGDFQIRQSDFGIPPVTAAAGTIRLKDEVKCTFDILARIPD
jgi:polyisoprenoid-binding protein YceI